MPCPEKLHGAASGHPCLARNETSSPWGALAKARIISGGALGVWDNPLHTHAHIRTHARARVRAHTHLHRSKRPKTEPPG